MKSIINRLALVALLQSTAILYSQEPQPAFFSFVNAVDSDAPTVLTVNGKKMGDPFPMGFYTGGMGFMEQSAAISIENGSLPSMQATISLKPDNSPIVIAYLKIIPPPAGSDALPKKTIGAISLPCSTAKRGTSLRAVYVGSERSIDVDVKPVREAAHGASGSRMKLALGVPTEIPLKTPPLEFFGNGESIGTYNSEAGENYLLVFFKNSDGKLSFVSALDTVFH